MPPGPPPDSDDVKPSARARALTQDPGYKTSAFWGKTALQVILIINVLFGLGMQIDDEFALALAGVMESTYAISRGISSRARAQSSIAAIRREFKRDIATAVTAAVAQAMRTLPPQQSTVNVSVQKDPPAP